MNKKILSVNNYSKKTYPSLPYNGWFKPCYYCKEITANILIKNNLKYYICKKCIKPIKLKSKPVLNTLETNINPKKMKIDKNIELSNITKCGCIIT